MYFKSILMRVMSPNKAGLCLFWCAF